jgi:hypothetical protein
VAIEWRQIEEAIQRGQLRDWTYEHLREAETVCHKHIFLGGFAAEHAIKAVREAIQSHESKRHHTAQDARFKSIEERVEGIHAIASRPPSSEWKSVSLWVSIISAGLAGIALLVSWLAWQRPVVQSVSVVTNSPTTTKALYPIATGAAQLQQLPHPTLKPTNKGLLLQPTNAVP